MEIRAQVFTRHVVRLKNRDLLVDPSGIVVASTDVGVEKPNPSIVTIAATRAGLPPAKCLFVGESLVELIGAQAAGMCAQLRPPA